MIIYKDIITGDELFSDAYPMKLINDCVFEVEGKRTTEKGGIDEALIGGNASAEGGDEGACDSDITEINVIRAGNLQPTGFTKATYAKYIKGYMADLKKRLEETNPARVDAFMKGATERVKWIMANIGDLEFYTGESMNPDGMAIPLGYREDGMTPYFIFFKDGLIEEKF